MINNNLINSTANNFVESASTTNAVASLKMAVFDIGNLKLALRIETIYKVLNQIPVYGSGANGVGIAHVGDLEVTVVDLHRQLVGTSLVNDGSQKGYLIVIQNSHGELYGVPVAAVPTLRDIPLSHIRVLPESFRFGNMFAIATHVAVIPQENQASLTIFLLDTEHLVASR